MRATLTTVILSLLILGTFGRRPIRQVIDRPDAPLNFLRGIHRTPRLLSALSRQSASSPTPKPKGYIFDECYTDDHCLGERRCIRGDQKAYCNGEEGCYCVMPLTDDEKKENDIPANTTALKYQLCRKCKECEFYPDETCLLRFADDDDMDGLCASTYTVYEGILRETNCNTYPEATQYVPEFAGPLPTPTKNQYQPGKNDVGFYNLDEDEDDTSGSDTSGADNSEPSVSATPTPVPFSQPPASPAQNNPDICVDAALLDHLPRSQLVFREHRYASVMCDGDGSCATPGHIVVHRRKPMTMRRYCAVVGGCKYRNKLVNSPKIRPGLRVASRTEELHFTPFAARYETKLEELVLRAVIHMGY